jgi:succinyl-CoA synthetase beta subunit
MKKDAPNSRNLVKTISQNLRLCFINFFPDVKEYVIKAQILAGGRGKGHFSNGFKGGVHVTAK